MCSFPFYFISQSHHSSLHPIKSYAPEAMERYRKNRSVIERKMHSTRMPIFSRESYFRYIALSDTARLPARRQHAIQVLRVRGLFSPGYLLFLERSRATAGPGFWWELFSLFLRYFPSPLSFVIGPAAVGGLSRIRRCRLPSVSVSRKSFSGMCVQRIFFSSVVMSSAD